MGKPSARPKGRRSGDRVAATILMPAGVDVRLSAHAKLRKLDRSTLAVKLIDAGMRSYREDEALRAMLGDVGPAGDAA